MTLLAAFDHTNINNLDPNLVPKAVANSALRKAFLDQVAAEFDLIIAAVNTPASASTEGSMSIADKLKLNSIITTSMPSFTVPIDTELTIGNFRIINVSATGELETREY